jgi:hypothetical protein
MIHSYKSRLIAIIAVFSLVPFLVYSQNAWINELHYDNAGTDAGEFIEVVIQNAGTYSLADFSVVLYNGSNGQSYDTKTLDLFATGVVSGSYSLYYYSYPANGIQNGAPDGMALVYQGAVISGQWLSYEGTMTAAIGPASGMLSVDIGVIETGTEVIGNSLQLAGLGASYSDFLWQGPADDTPGQLNNNQTFPAPPVDVPLSSWAVILGSVLIGLFAYSRIRKIS